MFSQFSDFKTMAWIGRMMGAMAALALVQPAASARAGFAGAPTDSADSAPGGWIP